jgi:uncharacterized phosphatase
MTAICLIRHGETDWNLQRKLQGSTDIPLNETGIEQARKTGEHLKDTEWDIIVASPLIRAKKTAEIINEFLNLPIIEMEEFKERDFGDAEGMSLEERTTKKYNTKNYPNQQNIEEFTERLMTGLSKVQKQFPGKKVLVVAHGGAIQTILTTVSNGEINLDNTPLVNACISNIQFAEEAWKVTNYNLNEHLL